MYKYLKNPTTNRWVSINNKQGLEIISKYLKQNSLTNLIGGGAIWEEKKGYWTFKKNKENSEYSSLESKILNQLKIYPVQSQEVNMWKWFKYKNRRNGYSSSFNQALQNIDKLKLLGKIKKNIDNSISLRSTLSLKYKEDLAYSTHIQWINFLKDASFLIDNRIDSIKQGKKQKKAKAHMENTPVYLKTLETPETHKGVEKSTRQFLGDIGNLKKKPKKKGSNLKKKDPGVKQNFSFMNPPELNHDSAELGMEKMRRLTDSARRALAEFETNMDKMKLSDSARRILRLEQFDTEALLIFCGEEDADAELNQMDIEKEDRAKIMNWYRLSRPRSVARMGHRRQ